MTPERDAEMDAALTSVLGDLDDEGEDEEAPEPEGSQDAPDPDPEDEGSDEPEETTEESDDDSTEDRADAQTGEHAKALNGLRLLGAPDDLLEALAPEAAVKWWNKRKKAESEFKAIVEERNELRRQLTERPTEAPGTQGSADPGAKEPTAGQSEEQAKRLAAFEEEFGEEARAALEAEFAAERKAREAVEARLARIEKQSSEAQAAQMAEALNATREELGSRFPGLHDDETYQKVYDAADALARARPERYQKAAQERGGVQAAIRLAFEDALRLEGVEEIQGEAAERSRQLARQRRNGQPVRHNRTRDPRPVSEEDLNDYRALLAAEGHTADEIRAKVAARQKRA